MPEQWESTFRLHAAPLLDKPVDRAIVALPRTNGNAPRHYRALPHRDVAAAVGAIRRVKYIHPSAVLCVEMIVLTAVRAGEARGARRDDIDNGGGAVDDPGVEDEGRARALSPEPSPAFFSKTGGQLPRNAPGHVLRRAGVTSTVHRFHSSARSSMAESGVPAEACLAHVPRGQVVQAYQRSNLLERRVEVLQAWCDYVTQR